MLIHSMASQDRVHKRDGYIQKYIFRDSNQIRLHLLLAQASRLDMAVADVENIGRHYHFTLFHWRKNLIEAYERDPSISERNFRVQLYFLECGMSESRFGDGALYHILLFKDPRDYTNLWRIDGRLHDPAKSGIIDRPFHMVPSDQNQHLHNDQFADGKKAARVYQRPSYRQRISQVVDILRSVSHQ
jgi:hypothetical protein